MTVAIFGLVGVVIGGLLNGGVTWLAERKREKRAARIQARSLLGLLLDGEIALRQTEAEGRLLVPRDLGARIRSLDLSALNGQVDDDAWIDLATAVYMVETSSEWSDEEFTPKTAEWFGAIANSVHAGLDALRPWALPTKHAMPPVELPKRPDE